MEDQDIDAVLRRTRFCIRCRLRVIADHILYGVAENGRIKTNEICNRKRNNVETTENIERTNYHVLLRVSTVLSMCIITSTQ